MNPPLSKLKIKPEHSLLVLNSPADYIEASSQTDLKPVAKKQYDAVQLFVKSKAEVDKSIDIAIRALKPGGLFWVSYPKKSSGIKTDLTRDHGWNILTEASYEVVAIISIDDTWSAVRFKPAGNVAEKKSVADKIPVKLQHDRGERVVDIPKELKSILNKNAKAKLFFDSLSFTNRKEYALWISSAKKEETRKKRLKDALDKLLKGKKNPSEK